MAATQGDTVQVHYTGRLESGEVFDTSREREPLQFTLGERQVVPGFENGVLGMNEGETKTIEVPPEEGYGDRDEQLVREIPRSEVQIEDLKPGHVLQLQSHEGQVFQGLVTNVTDESVTLDFNHFLAGRTLTFEVELVGIQ